MLTIFKKNYQFTIFLIFYIFIGSYLSISNGITSDEYHEHLNWEVNFSARQLINHGHIKVNGKKVNISSYQLKEEETIEVRDKSKQLAFIDVALANKEREVPEYLQVDEKNKKVKFVRIPKFEEVPYPVVMEPNLVIEYYSR